MTTPNPSVSAPGHGGTLSVIDELAALIDPVAYADHNEHSVIAAMNRTDARNAARRIIAKGFRRQADPDLLAACERILPFLESWGRGSHFTADSIRTAVAKAHRGEAGSARGMG